MDDTENRNNLDSPPRRPALAWGEQTQAASKTDLLYRSASGPTCLDRPIEDPTSTDSIGAFHTYGRPSSQPISEDLPLSPSGPTPVPRKRTNSHGAKLLFDKSKYEQEIRSLTSRVEKLTREKTQLTQQKESLKDKNSELESVYSKLSEDYMTAQSLISHKSTLTQSLETEVEKLTHSLSQVRFEPSQPDTSDQQRSELAKLKLQLEENHLLVSKLEQDKKDLKRSMSSPSTEPLEQSTLGAPQTSTRASKRIEQRTIIKLEETMKKMKLLEQENIDLRQKLLENEKVKEILEKEQLAHALQEKEILSDECQQLSSDLLSTRDQLASTMSDLNSKCSELKPLEESYFELQNTMEGCVSRCDDLEENLAYSHEELTHCRQKYSSLEEANTLTIQELTKAQISLRGQTGTLSAELDEVTSQRDSLSVKLTQLTQVYERASTDLQNIQQHCGQLVGEKKKEERMYTQALDDIQKEADAALGDYDEAACRLKEVERERDEFRIKHEQKLGILAERSQQLMDLKKKFGDCEQEKSILQMKLDNYSNTYQVMDAQLSVFKEDFTEERRARETMAAETEVLRDQLRTKDIEMRNLKSKLNMQASLRMEDDFEEISGYPDDNEPPLRASAPDHGFNPHYPGRFIGQGRGAGH